MIAGCAEEDIAGEAARPGLRANSCDADKVCEANQVKLGYSGSLLGISPGKWDMNIARINEDYGIEIGDVNTNGVALFSSGKELLRVQDNGDVSTLFFGQKSDLKSLVDVKGSVILSSDGSYLGRTRDGWDMNLIRQNDFQIDVGDVNTNGINFGSSGIERIVRISGDDGVPQIRVMGTAFIDELARLGNVQIAGNTIDTSQGWLLLSSKTNEVRLDGTLNVYGDSALITSKKVSTGEVETSGLTTSGPANIRDLTISSLAVSNSTSISYACINASGGLFRSDTPCR